MRSQFCFSAEPQVIRFNELLATIRRSFFSEKSPDISILIENLEVRTSLILVLAKALIDLLPSDLKRLATTIKFVEVIF